MLKRKPGLRQKYYGHDLTPTNEELEAELKKLNKVDKKKKK